MANEIRVGKISAVNHAAGTVRVVYHDKDDAVTRPIPLLGNEYYMPEVGDQVLVLHLSNGLEAGVVLGRYWNDKNRPPEGAAGLYRKDLDRTPGEAMIRYKSGVLTLKAARVVVDGNLQVTGDLDVTGAITSAGVSLKNHTHTCSCALSSGNTSPPV